MTMSTLMRPGGSARCASSRSPLPAKTPLGRRPPLSALLPALICALVLPTADPASAGQQALASDWQSAHAARARLVAAGGPLPGKPLEAAIEIELAEGWKTYWRFPGDAGGVPPAFDWSGSQNASMAVLFPAPMRYTDRAGDTVGYKGIVVLPVRLAVSDPTKPVSLRLKLDYGICREICVPAEANLSLDLPPGSTASVPPAVAAALARVPGPPTAGTPKLVTHDLALTGDKPRITFDVLYPGSGTHADAFVEASGGLPLPLPRKDGAPRDGRQTFVVDLTPADIPDLKGKTLTITLVSDDGQSETTLPLP